MHRKQLMNGKFDIFDLRLGGIIFMTVFFCLSHCLFVSMITQILLLIIQVC